jgi:exodeoxyribonuclease (lambda-induced)
MIIYRDEQGSPEWEESRRGAITGSRFRDCRDKLKNGKLSNAAMLYAQDVARERCGGRAAQTFANAAMKFGTEQEPFARQAYEARTGNLVDEAGFITTDDGKFGISVDGLVDDDGIIEIKTMVSSATLFRAVVDGDITDYVDQINGALWLLGRKWADLVLWAPDMPEGARLTIVHIKRDDDVINALEADLIAFEATVTELEGKLRALLTVKADEQQPELFDAACEMHTVDVLTVPASPEHSPTEAVEVAELEAERVADLMDGVPKMEGETPELTTQPAASLPVAKQEVAGNLPQSEPCAVIHASDPTVAEPVAEVVSHTDDATGRDVLTEPRTQPTLKGGDICARLGFTLQAVFIAETLGVPWSDTAGSAKLWHESDFPRIKAALIKHVEAAQ